MKRTMRFIQWFISKCGWYEAIMFITSFTFFAGLTAGEGKARTIYWGIAIAVNFIVIIRFMYKGCITLWRDFIKDDEKIFDILKKDYK